MIGVIVPAHDEEKLIEACLLSIRRASRHADLQGEEVKILVVIDACTDATGPLARHSGASTVDVTCRNVGMARKIGADLLVAQGARWLAFTDADSEVSPDWLACQLALETDVVCGTVSVADWSDYGESLQRHFELTYSDRDGHAHIHGANLGVSTQAYLAAGGFEGVETGEDVALVDALRRNGATIAWSAAPRVVTSARAAFRAPSGFGATLQRIDRLNQRMRCAALIASEPIALGMVQA